MKKAKSLTCPNCGANISSVEISNPTVICPQCKQVVSNPLYKQETDIAVNVIPQDYDRKQFLLKIVEDLENDKKVAPQTIDQIPDAEIHMFYLLVYYFDCTYNAPWSGIYWWKEDQGYKNANGTEVFIKRQQFINGDASGRRELLYCDASKETMQKLPKIIIDKALEICNSGPSEGMVSKHLSELSEEEKGQLEVPETESLWNNRALPDLKESAIKEAENQMDSAVHGNNLQTLSIIAHSIINDKGITNKNIQFQYEINNQEVGYVPYVYAKYEIDGIAYYSVAKADKNLTGIFCDSPSDHEAATFVKSHEEKLEDEEKNAGCSSSILGIIIAIISYFCFEDEDSAWLIALGLGIVVGYFYYKYRQKKLDELNEEAHIRNQPIKDELNAFLSAKASDKKDRADNARRRIMNNN